MRECFARAGVSLTEVVEKITREVPAEEKVRLLLEPGVYEGPVRFERGNMEILAGGPTDGEILGTASDCPVRISGNLSAREILEDGTNRGTFRTQTAYIHADNLLFRGISFENTAGPGHEKGQCIAAYVDGDLVRFENCAFLGYQDTLFTAPLPLKEVQPGGFRGPGEHLPRTPRRQIYEECRIEGSVDFIFGGAAAVFDRCRIVCREDGYVTAASTPEGQKMGYLFRNSSIEAWEGVKSVYLGRPWREHAKTVFLNCEMGPQIEPQGWQEWSGRIEAGGVFYAEYGSSGPGAAGNRITKSVISPEEAEAMLTALPEL